MPLSNLDSDQIQAATAEGDEVVISAGAGSGKTRLLVARYLHLIRNRSVPLSSVVAITFTEKAASQMKVEIAEKARSLAANNHRDREMWDYLIGYINSAPISTIHSFCNGILRNFPIEANIDPHFSIVDTPTLYNLTEETLDTFFSARFSVVPDDMELLVRTFGSGRLRWLFHTLLAERTRFVTFLDSYDGSNPEVIKYHTVQTMLYHLKNHLTNLERFHALAPGDDALAVVLDDLVTGMKTILDLAEKGHNPHENIQQIMEQIKVNRGSVDKWSQSGVRIESVKKNIKECGVLLDALRKFYLDEQEIIPQITALIAREFHELERLFLTMKKNRSYFDHDDTLIETWRLLRNNTTVCQKVSQMYRHILVDEFQDTDGLQMDIIRIITGNSSSGLFTVGDPKQSIYRFRGADVTIFNEFIAKTHVDFKTLKKNYRSSPSIIAFINHTFGRIMGKDDPYYSFDAQYVDMKPHRKEKDTSPHVEVVVVEGENIAEQRVTEATFIAQKVHEMRDTYGYSFGDMALLLRKGTQTQPYEETFLSSGIPYTNFTSGDPFRSPEAYDIANLLGWLVEPSDTVLFTAILLSPIFHVKPEILYALHLIAGESGSLPISFLYDEHILNHPWVAGNSLEHVRAALIHLLRMRDRTTIRGLLEGVYEKSEYTLILLADPVRGELSLSIIDYILDIADTFEEHGGSLIDFARLLSHRALASEEMPSVETDGDTLSLITIHKAKGMEYKVVFLADCSSRGQPDSKSLSFDKDFGIGFSVRDVSGNMIKTSIGSLIYERDKQKSLAESKRLFYVGCTRAMDFLIISGGTPSKAPDTKYEKGNWMSWLHTALDISSDSELLSPVSRNLCLYRRIPRTETVERISSIDSWSEVLAKIPTAAPVNNLHIEHLLKKPEKISYHCKPTHLSTTEIEDYLLCPAYYYLKHVYKVVLSSTEKTNGESGDGYGLFAHSILENWDFTTTDLHTILKTTHHNEHISSEWIERLEGELRRFQNTALYHRIRESHEIRREESFVFVLDDVIIRGKIDLLYRDKDTWSLVDYKTEHVDQEEVVKVSERYLTQLGIYSYAVFCAENIMPSRCELYYLYPNVSRETFCSIEFLDGVKETLHRVIASMGEGDYSPKTSDRCHMCPYATICEK